ncbi:S8 family serine peptidase [Photobacterium aquimaris]|uniref:Microbial serine proteinase n=1 Tax=Photobacterium aquimaris TaxID=512643 RepID=A0A1Y6KTY3_9GAMM|nr:S8 family serine peptidase [Photobacterium aquimaris]SMY15643.1 Microbial serine proteinase precursor [Photobacterium aquimaris]
MNKKIFLGTIIAALLSGCGGDSDKTDTVVKQKPIIKSGFFSSSTNVIKGKIDFSGVDNPVFTYNNKDLKGGRLTINTNGEFEFVAKPYSGLIRVDVKIQESTQSLSIIKSEKIATLEFLTEQRNKLNENSDQFYKEQWHLNNTEQNAFSNSNGTYDFDINLDQLHNQAITGKAIKVAVVDTGLELAHPDLSSNIIANSSYDFVDNDDDPSPNTNDKNGDHGTSVAGLISAVAANNIGGRGVAPDSQLAGFNYLKNQSIEVFKDTHGYGKTNNIDIINQSYGFAATIIFPIQSLDFNIKKVLIEEYYDTHTKPALMIKSAGNGFNYIGSYARVNTSKSEQRLPNQIANSDPENASFYNTVVSALSADANNPRSSYSTVGSSVLFSAPGGEYGVNHPAMITTDVTGCDNGYSRIDDENDIYSGGFTYNIQKDTNCNFTSIFNGTSSAAPVASGVAALIMEANPTLTWRDVRYIMAKTATKVDLDFEPVILEQQNQKYIADDGWITNKAGNSFHNWYGFGMVNAQKAVQVATRDYSLLPELQQTDFVISTNQEIVLIPENFDGVVKQVQIEQNIKVEAVQLKLNIDHNRFSDLAIEVISPSGTRSVVVTPRNLHIVNPKVFGDESEVILLSHAFLDESSEGLWTIKIVDANKEQLEIFDYNQNESFLLSNNNDLGKVISAKVKIYGHK